MRIHRKAGRFRAVVAVVVLAVGALAIPSSAVPASTQSAESTTAAPTCLDPTTTTFSARGVTVCEFIVPDGKIYIQKIDLNAGAKVRLISDGCYECLPPHQDTDRNTDLQYHKRTAPEWFDWLQDPANLRTPGPNRLFSTSNGTFFVDISPFTSTSTLSMPEKSVIEKFPDGGAFVEDTLGWAYDTCPDNQPPLPTCHEDFAWDKAKVALSFGDSTAAKQKVEMLNFPTHYTPDDYVELTHGVPPGECCVDFERISGDQTVGYPAAATEGSSPRTYLGLDSITGAAANTVYILNTSAPFTGTQVEDLLQLEGATSIMQLDGGGSTQLSVDYDQNREPTELIESDVIVDRGVPEALAVYLGP